MKERFKSIVAVFMLLERGEEIFLMRRANTGYMDGMYGLPAGHHDGGEFLRESAARELREELGIMADPARMEFVLTVHRPFANDGDRVDVYFRVTEWRGELQNIEPGKCDDLGWFKKTALPANLIPKEQLAFAEIFAGKQYLEYDDR
jgi:ADP-ribose pyrophosphatase YjhB (NUDIX family)